MLDIYERANGRWFGILSALGVETRFLKNLHGPCPACGGTDRFRWDNKNGMGTFFCNNCGSGNGFTLLLKIKGWDFKYAAEQIETVIGKSTFEQPKRIMSDDEQRRAMQKRWNECVQVEPDSPVARYLFRRVGIAIIPSTIRSAPDRPAMVALMQAPDDRATMVHTTFLTEDGHKANVTPVRKMMHASIAPGAAVRLGPVGEAMGVAEGIETALAASVISGMPCWAALNEGLMQKWEPPKSVKHIVVFGDNDRNYVGQSAAYMLARKISLRKNPPIVEVRIPDLPGNDWNDVLNEKIK